MYGWDSKGTFKIPYEISYPCIGKCAFYSLVKIYKLLAFWSAPGTLGFLFVLFYKED